MKKGILFGVVIGILIIGTYFLIKTPVEDKALISYAQSCENMKYPGAWAFTHGGDPPCDHVYRSAFSENNSEICDYLRLDKDKAICFGSSVTSWKDRGICNQLEGDSSEICILNILNKLNYLDLLSYIKETSICSDFKNQDLKRVCEKYQNVISQDYSPCLLEEDIDNYCVYGFITLNQESSSSKSLCEEAFGDSVKRFKCLFGSKAIDSTWLNESVDVGTISEIGIEKNVSFLFSEIYIETEYPILLRYVKSYWMKNPHYTGGYEGSTGGEFILSTDIEDYICNKKIKEIYEIELNCILYNWSDLFDTSSFPKVHWNYDTPYNY